MTVTSTCKYQCQGLKTVKLISTGDKNLVFKRASESQGLFVSANFSLTLVQNFLNCAIILK